MYVNFPGREEMRKCGCMRVVGDLDAARTIRCQNPSCRFGWGTLCELSGAGAPGVSEGLSKIKYVQARYSST